MITLSGLAFAIVMLERMKEFACNRTYDNPRIILKIVNIEEYSYKIDDCNVIKVQILYKVIQPFLNFIINHLF
jgi:hypothetical protein